MKHLRGYKLFERKSEGEIVNLLLGKMISYRFEGKVYNCKISEVKSVNISENRLRFDVVTDNGNIIITIDNPNGSDPTPYMNNNCTLIPETDSWLKSLSNVIMK
jgi:hypothetical protein